MISQPCRECGTTFWVDDEKIPEEFASSKSLIIIPLYCNSGIEHRMRALRTVEVFEPDNPSIIRATLDIASDYL